MQQTNLPNSNNSPQPAHSGFGGVLRILEVYCFVMLIRGGFAFVSSGCSLLLSQGPNTPVPVLPAIFSVATVVSFFVILLRFLRVPTPSARTSMRLLFGLYAIFLALLGAVALLSLPESVSSSTEQTAAQLSLSAWSFFFDSLLAQVALIFLTLSARAKDFYALEAGTVG